MAAALPNTPWLTAAFSTVRMRYFHWRRWVMMMLVKMMLVMIMLVVMIVGDDYAGDDDCG